MKRLFTPPRSMLPIGIEPVKLADLIPPKPKRRIVNREEQDIQIALLKWWQLTHRSFGVDERSLIHIPNSARRGVIEGMMMKRMGVRAGHEDLFLSVPRGGFHGLYVEMKSSTGTVEPHQVQMIAMHRGNGYRSEVCNSLQSAINTITSYLTQKP